MWHLLLTCSAYTSYNDGTVLQLISVSFYHNAAPAGHHPVFPCWNSFLWVFFLPSMGSYSKKKCIYIQLGGHSNTSLVPHRWQGWAIESKITCSRLRQNWFSTGLNRQPTVSKSRSRRRIPLCHSVWKLSLVELTSYIFWQPTVLRDDYVRNVVIAIYYILDRW